MRFRNFPVYILAIASFLILGSPAFAQLEKHLGPLAPGVELGSDGVWDAVDDGGWFRLTNEREPNSLTYFWASEVSDAAAFRISTYVAVRPLGGNVADGGIMFNRRDSDNYMGYTLADDNSLNLFVRSPDGLDVQPLPDAQARGDGTDQLSVVIDGNDASLELNGEFLFKVESTGRMARTAGILAAGTAHVGFTGFRIEPVAARRPAPPPLPGQTDRDPQAGLLTEEEAVLGAAIGVWLHEMAHALIGETGLPAPGNEEDIADSFSAHAFAQILQGAPPEARDANRRIAEASGLIWYEFARRAEQQQIQSDWQGEHSPDIRRFRNWLCTLYGFSPADFGPLADRVELNQRTRHRCQAEYPLKLQAWEELLETRGRNLSPEMPGDYPADHPGGKLILTFQEGADERARATAHLLETNGTIATMTGVFERYFIWPRDLRIDFRSCQEVNMWYDPVEHSVTMCYNAIDLFASLIVQ